MNVLLTLLFSKISLTVLQDDPNAWFASLLQKSGAARLQEQVTRDNLKEQLVQLN